MMRRQQSCEEGKKVNMEVNQQAGDGEAAARGENPSRTCKLPAGGVVLLVLVGLLAAALIVVFRLSFDKIQMNQTIKTLKEENEALRRNQSDKMCLKWANDWDQYEEKCYYFNFIKSSWTDSRRSCADLGSDLVKIHSREEQMFLNKRLRDLMVDDEDKFWIGLTDSGEEGRWFWVDGSPLDESLHFWIDGQPDDKSGNIPDADCVRMGRKGDGEPKCWFDRFCDHLQKSICEKKPNQKNTCVFF